MRYLRLKFGLFGVLWSDALGSVMRSVVEDVSYKLVSTILVLVPNLDIVTTVKGIITSAFSGIILTYRFSLALP